MSLPEYEMERVGLAKDKLDCTYHYIFISLLFFVNNIAQTIHCWEAPIMVSRRKY